MGGKAWTEEEKEFVKIHADSMTNKEIADRIGRTASSVQLYVTRNLFLGEDERKPRRRDTYAGRRVVVGQRFGKLEVKRVSEEKGKTRCVCVCDCNPEVEVERFSSDLHARDNHSCGCEKIIKATARCTTHGLSKSPLYIHWTKMRDRCNNPNNDDYHRYGGRGITVCDEWEDFARFHEWANGHPDYSPGKTVHRKNNDKGYSPGNCTWATPKEQANSRSTNRLLTLLGETKTVKRWSEDSRAKACEITIRTRISNGWSDESAVLTEPRKQNKGA
jgi:hypothetical protein